MEAAAEKVAGLEQQDGFDAFGEEQPKRHDYEPERRLWTAVLLQAVLDWKSNNVRAQREAENFLFKSPTDFESACHRAGLNPSVFQTKLQRLHRSRTLGGLPQMILAA